MRLIFIFSKYPDLSDRLNPRIKTDIQLPHDALHLIGVEERIREIGKRVGELTQVPLHITCKDVGITNELMNKIEIPVEDMLFRHYRPIIALYFSGMRTRKRVVRICYPLNAQELDVPRMYYTVRGRNKKERSYLAGNVMHLSSGWIENEAQRNYYDALQSIIEQTSILLGADSEASHYGGWHYSGLNPMWFKHDFFSKQFKKEDARIASLEKKQSQNKNADKHGKGNRYGAIPGKFMGVQFRSQLEIRFATKMQQLGIDWIYEEERLGEGNYLVDFHLPEKRAWVEVKGRFEARDHYLLKDVAETLQKRGEKLYVYTSDKAKIVTPDGFTDISKKELWQHLQLDVSE